jgi:hypothetical protein
LLALALAISLGALGRSAPSHAQDTDPGDFQFLVDVIDPLRKPMCVGEKRDYLVRILEKGTIGSNQRIEDASITLGPGTTVNGQVADTSIADVASARTMLINSPSPTLIRPAVVAFTVKALKAGSTTIDFTASISFRSITIRAFPFTGVPITVEKCKYKASGVLEGAIIFPAGDGTFLGMIDEAEMTADPSGHYTGATTVSWIDAPTYLDDLCTIVFSLTPTTDADLSADIDESSQLVMDMDVRIPEISYNSDCHGVSRTGVLTESGLEQLQIAAPASGGIVTQADGLGYFHHAVFIVIPEEEQPVAFKPGDALVGWAILPNLFGELLALR